MIRKLLSDSIIYTVPAVLSRGIGLILLPVYARHLRPEEYGTIEVLAVTYVLLNLTLPLEVSQAVARFTGDTREAARRDTYVSTALVFTAAVFALFAVAAWLLPAAAWLPLLHDAAAAELMPLASLWMLANALLYLVMNQLRWNGLPRAYVAVNALFTILVAAGAVVLIAVLDYGTRGYVWSQLGASAIALLAGLYVLRRGSDVRLTLDIAALWTMLRFSAPLVISSLAVYATTYVDRWLLVAWRSPEELGVYAVGLRLASVVALATTGVQLALTPLVYAHHADPATPVALRRLFRLFLLGALAAIVTLAAYAPEIVGLLAGPPYAGAAGVAAMLAAAQLAANLYIFSPGLILAKKTARIAMLNAIGAGLNVAANSVLIPALGITGAAVGNLLAASVLATIYFRSSEPHYSIGYEWRRCLPAAVAVLALLAALQLVAFSTAWRSALWLIALGVLALLLITRADWRATSALLHRGAA